MKHEVEIMQNEMVVFCFFKHTTRKSVRGKKMENNEKPQLG